MLKMKYLILLCIIGTLILFPNPLLAEEICVFPDEINGYSKQALNDMGSEVPQKPEGLSRWLMVSYSGWNMVNFLTFDTEDNAKAYLTHQTNYEECEIGYVKGLCQFKTSMDTTPIQSQGAVIWREDKTIKTVTTMEQKHMDEDISDIEKEVRQKLELFVSGFKNCKIE